MRLRQNALTFLMPGLLEDASRGVLGIPLKPVLGLRRVYGLGQAAPNVPCHHKDWLTRVARVDRHLADGVPVFQLFPGLILGRYLVVILIR
jgi:hypothetical protein